MNKAEVGLIVSVSYIVNVISLFSPKCMHWCPDKKKYQTFSQI